MPSIASHSCSCSLSCHVCTESQSWLTTSKPVFIVVAVTCGMVQQVLEQMLLSPTEMAAYCLQVVGNTVSGNAKFGGVGGMGIDFCDGELPWSHHDTPSK